jgi:2-polyprenyl-3-methyl-5-hydroxy-6-metoxy-1,4-benzoquinol methylase
MAAKGCSGEVKVIPRPACRLCGGTGDRLYADLQDRLFSAPGTWQIKKCRNANCGLLWLDPEPSEEDIALLYRGYYTHGASQLQGSALRYAFRLGSAVLFRVMPIIKERKKLQSLFVDDLTPGDLLEVGCGAGSRLPLFAALGWRVTGQDVDADAAAEALRKTGIRVHVGPVAELVERGRRFDAIVMNHVIEHVLDPVHLLKICLSMLRPGGTMICITPNANGWGHRAYGVTWMALDPPRHVTIFTPSGLRTAAQMAGSRSAEVSTSCANAQAFAAGSVEIASKGRYDMNRPPAWRSEVLSVVAQFRALSELRRNPESGDELILRCRA